MFLSTQVFADGPFVKIPVTSYHFDVQEVDMNNGDKYPYNENNLGIGIGYEFEDTDLFTDMFTGFRPDIGLSLSHYPDSYECRATTLQSRVTTEFGRFDLGGALNLSDKCMNNLRKNEIFIAPSLSLLFNITNRARLAVDALPRVKSDGSGFIALSVEGSF